ncbi:hypothetical protein THAOC_21374 [Thalassiosira oceanica]|uniref:Uncharacterized protein n=1 Tax=Thalassiosira oceanica TaxID=159749 RepID=K0SJ22_THAOC|nr:hypothetical protein THAOC_21374 [Thalassiosira oceanica]|eukprot:EJK58492.1 hypothetical protein THAOC_21374 [Thalassiosira oceanica]
MIAKVVPAPDDDVGEVQDFFKKRLLSFKMRPDLRPPHAHLFGRPQHARATHTRGEDVGAPRGRNLCSDFSFSISHFSKDKDDGEDRPSRDAANERRGARDLGR